MSFANWLKRMLAPKTHAPIRTKARLEVERLEDRVQPSVSYYSITGAGNNLANPTWGQAGADLIRLAPAGYADGVSMPSLPNDQSARAISNIVNSQADPSNPGQDINTLDQQNLSDFGYAFGNSADPMPTTPAPANTTTKPAAIAADPGASTGPSADMAESINDVANLGNPLPTTHAR
jgi:hypothetical protein